MYNHLMGALRSGRLPQERGTGRPGPGSSFPYLLCARRLHELRRLVLLQCVVDYAALARKLDAAFPLPAPLQAGGQLSQRDGHGSNGGVESEDDLGEDDLDVSGSAAGRSEAATPRANKRAKTNDAASPTPARSASTSAAIRRGHSRAQRVLAVLRSATSAVDAFDALCAKRLVCGDVQRPEERFRIRGHEHPAARLVGSPGVRCSVWSRCGSRDGKGTGAGHQAGWGRRQARWGRRQAGWGRRQA